MRALLLVLLLAPLASAGTAEDPEITDPADDAGSRPGMDVSSMWIDWVAGASEPTLAFTFQMAGDPVHTPAFFAAHEEFRYNFVTEAMPNGAAEIYVSMRPTCSQVTVFTNVPTCQSDIASCRVGFAAAAGEYQDLAAETAVGAFMDGGTRMGCTATLNQLGLTMGANLLDGYITHRAVVRGPLSGGDEVGPEVVEEFDRAPDTGFGRDFATVEAVVEEPPEPTIEYVDIEVPYFAEYPGSSGDFAYNASYAAPLNLTINGTEGSASLVVASEGTVVMVWNGTQLAETLELGCTCNVTFHLTLEEFAGTFHLELTQYPAGEEPPAPADPTDPEPTPDEEPAIDTEEEEDEAPAEEAPEGKESPGLPMAVITVLLAFLARRR